MRTEKVPKLSISNWGGELLVDAEFPVRQNFLFTGWFLDENLTEAVDINSYAFIENAVLYASWQEVSTEVTDDSENYSELFASNSFTLNANGGTFPDGQSKQEANTVYLDSEKFIPVKEGQLFKGWYAEPECKNLLSYSEKPGNSMVYRLRNEPTSGSVIYAGWVDYYTITYIFGNEHGSDPVKDTGYYWDETKKERVKQTEIRIPVGASISNYMPSGSSNNIRNTDMHYSYGYTWYKDEDRTVEVSNTSSEIPTGNSTYYVGFVSNCVVTFHNIDSTAYFTRENYLYSEKEAQFDTLSYANRFYSNRFSPDDIVKEYVKNSLARRAIEGYYSDSEGTIPLELNINGLVTINGDADIYIKWADTNKVVTFDANGGYFWNANNTGDTSRTIVEIGHEASDETVGFNPGKVLHSDLHKRFAGWSTVKDTTSAPEFPCNSENGEKSIVIPITEDEIYYAVWSDDYHVITLNAGEGVFTYTDDDTKEKHENVTVASIRTTRSGIINSKPYDNISNKKDYIFEYWYLGNERINYLEVYSFMKDATITAKYVPSYTITFDAGEGTFSYYDTIQKKDIDGVHKASFKTDKDGLIRKIPYENRVIPPNENSFFIGWYDGDTKVDSRTVYTKNTVIKAKYIPIYTVEFDGNGGTFDYYDEAYVKHEGVEKAILRTGKDGALKGYISGKPVIADENKIFDAWYDGDTKIDKIIGLVPSRNMTIKANYIKGYKVTLDANGGYFSVVGGYTDKVVIELEEGDSEWLTSPSYENNAKTFGGWYEDKECLGDKVNSPFSPTRSVTLYAKWYETKTVTFECGEGSIDGKSSVPYYVLEGEKFGLNNKLPENPIPEDEDRAFIGWFKNASLADEDRIDRDEILELIVTDDITLYAGYKDAYTVTFDVGTNGGSFASITDSTYSIKVAEGEAIKWKAPTVVTTDEKVFEGWFTTPKDGGEEITNLYSYKVETDQILYARFTDCYTITFHAGMPGAKLDGVESPIKVRVAKGTAFRYSKDEQDEDVLFIAPVLDYSSVTTDKLPFLSYQYCVLDYNQTKNWWVSQVGWTTNKPGDDKIYYFGNDDYNQHWYVDKNGVNNFSPNGFIPTESMDFYVKWADPVNVTFDANGGTFKEGSAYDIYGKLNKAKNQRVLKVPKGMLFPDILQPQKLDMNAKTDGDTKYNFICYQYSDTTPIQYIDRAAPITSDTTFYAYWAKSGNGGGGGGTTPIVKTLTLHAGEGYFAYYAETASQQYTSTSLANTYFTSIPSSYDDNKAFCGWYIDEELQTRYSDSYQGSRNGSWYILIPEEITDLYAKYDYAYTVKFDANGGYFDRDCNRTKDPDEEIRSNTSISIKQEISGVPIVVTRYTERIRRDGNKIFAGWYTDKKCTEKAKLFMVDSHYEYYNPTANVTLYAKWMNYDLPDTITAEIDKDTLTVGDTAKLTSNVAGANWRISSSSVTGVTNPENYSSISIDVDGNVSATAPGRATVYAEYNGLESDRITIIVKKADDEEMPSLTLDQKKITVPLNGTATITATVTPSSGASKVTCVTDRSDIVNWTYNITSDGRYIVKMSPLNPGTVVFRFKYEGLVDETTVTVEDTVLNVKAPKANIGILNSTDAVKVSKGTKISMTSDTYGADIFYTVDGSDPEFDAEGKPVGEKTVLYTDAIEIKENVIIKAAATIGGGRSEVVTYKYEIEKEDWGDIDDENGVLRSYLKDVVFGGDSSNIENRIWYVFGNNEAVGYDNEHEVISGQTIGISKLYSGDKITFNDDIRVYIGNRRLIENRDYTLVFSNNTGAVSANAAKQPTVTISGKGNYKFSSAFKFTITQASIDNAEITSEKVVSIVASNSVKLGNTKPVVVFGGKKLTLNKDYILNYYKDSVSAENRIAYPEKEIIKSAGNTYLIQIVAKDGGNYTGTKADIVEVRAIEKSSNIVQVSKLKVGDLKGKSLKATYDGNALDIVKMFDNNGEEKTAVAQVTYGSGKSLKVLTYGVDYEIVLTDNVPTAYISAGKHNFVIRGIDKSVAFNANPDTTDIWYVGDKNCTIEIAGTAISKAKIAGLNTTVEYTGAPITLADIFNAKDKNLLKSWTEPTLYIFDNKTKTKTALVRSEDGITGDYIVSMNNTGVTGKFDLIFQGINGYTGTVKKTITVKAHSMAAGATGISIKVVGDDTKSIKYIKSGAKPALEVKYGETLLTEGVDYTVTYKNNTKVFNKAGMTAAQLKNAPTATIKGMGNFTGQGKSETFSIWPSSVYQINVVANDVVYNPKGKSGYFFVLPKLMDDGKAVSAGKAKNSDIYSIDKKADYKYYYQLKTILEDGTDTKAATVRAAGEQVVATDKIPAGTTIKVVVTVKPGGVNSPYSFEGASTAELVGYYRILGGKDKDISKYTVKVKDSSKLYFNNGMPITLSKSDLEVYSGTGAKKVVLKASDYDIVSFTGGSRVGNATLVLKGKGSYGGTKTVTLKITARTR